MRSATILKRARTWPPVASPRVYAIGAVVMAVLLGALWLWSSSAAVAFGLLLLVASAWRIVALARLVRRLADHDALTGTASRAFFVEALVDALEKGQGQGQSVSVAVLDCDDFKRINERFGHAVGDNVLIEVALVLQRRVGERGTVGRIWGDAFAVVLPGTPLASARTILGEAQESLAQRMAQNGWPVTFSVGMTSRGEALDEKTVTGADASLEGALGTAAELLAEADALMFSAKRRAHDRVRYRGPQEETGAAPHNPALAERSSEQSCGESVRSSSPELATKP
jgi:diguanylate cyclase (GGDEF)-like protein